MCNQLARPFSTNTPWAHNIAGSFNPPFLVNPNVPLLIDGTPIRYYARRTINFRQSKLKNPFLDGIVLTQSTMKLIGLPCLCRWELLSANKLVRDTLRNMRTLLGQMTDHSARGSAWKCYNFGCVCGHVVQRTLRNLKATFAP
ncbi:MAG: hypothetical protein Q9192_004397 [Flavoplaca navasiana]